MDLIPPPDGSFEAPVVETLSIAKDPQGNLILVIDGNVARLPGASASAALNEEGKIIVYAYAQFQANSVDLSALEQGA